jgi:hypothetical protein
MFESSLSTRFRLILLQNNLSRDNGEQEHLKNVLLNSRDKAVQKLPTIGPRWTMVGHRDDRSRRDQSQNRRRRLLLRESNLQKTKMTESSILIGPFTLYSVT